MKRFLGFPYPVEKTSQGYFYSQSEIDQIKSDIAKLEQMIKDYCNTNSLDEILEILD